MRWYLVYRDDRQMRELAADLPPDAVARVNVFREPDDCIVFLEVGKAEA